jgi:chromosome segregation protein
MRIERIELIGFKSFADKTVFKFHPGSTAIVGPNGCGKSNIVDAFKWVLGEQSAKSLRGDNMADVIFAGSSTKKTKGMAEVTMVLSDIIKKGSNGSDNNGSKETTKISVTRRLFRSGESQYLMNKVPCRLKDIKNTFLDTGLELKAYSILEQGRMDNILNSKPQDRRFLIEEVAGVMKYKVRKQEAMNKLESSRGNLQRLQDIIAEVKRQINTIDRHARKAERYKKLLHEIRDIELRIAKRDVQSLRRELNELAMSEETLKSREAEVSAHVHSTESIIEEKKRLAVEHERKLNEIRNGLYALEREVTEDEGKINLLKRDCENMRERLESFIKLGEELDEQKGTTTASLHEIRKDETEMEQELEKAGNILKEKQEGFAEAEEEVNGLEYDLESARKDLFHKAEEISNTKNEINQIKITIENIHRKAEKNTQDMDSVSANIASVKISLEQTGSELEKSTAALEEEKKAKEEIVYSLKNKKLELSVQEGTLYKEREELAALVSKHESLKEIDSSQMQSIDETVKTLCQVADILETPQEYETAIEAILGDKLGAAIVEDRDEIIRAIRHIKEKKSQRSGFITVNPVNRAVSSFMERANSKDGIVGEAAEFITIKEGFGKVASSMLQDVILVKNLDAAFSLWEMHDRESVGSMPCFVTLDGEVLEPNGMVFAGSQKGVLKIKRMIKEIEGAISSKKDSAARAEENVRMLKEVIISLENKAVSIDGTISSSEKYCHELTVKSANLREEQERLLRKHEYIGLEINDDHREKDNLKNSLNTVHSTCTGLEQEKLLLEEKIKSIQRSIADKRNNIETMRSELTEIKLNLTASTEKIGSIRREINRFELLLEDIDRKKEQTQVNYGTTEKNIQLKEEEIQIKDGEMKTKILKVGELQENASKTQEILEAKNAELAVIEKQAKELAHELEKVRSELSHVEMKKMEQSMKLDYIKEDMRKAHSVEVEQAEISDSVRHEEEERLPQLKEKISSIGPVSLGTLDEYEELKTRYEFLTKQRDDLTAAIEALQSTINKINRTTQKRLSDAFEALNEKFKEVFTILFGNGRAELRLTEGSILDAGIDIVAQPPGKRLQNLMLLSGGEKALTALSLLFAGFMIKPTPLCLLDEVDAPLDESNTERFIKLLTELAKEIQFITITHNRRTMEAADYIYGITMEEPGSSKVVSMHLAEAEPEPA